MHHRAGAWAGPGEAGTNQEGRPGLDCVPLIAEPNKKRGLFLPLASPILANPSGEETDVTSCIRTAQPRRRPNSSLSSFVALTERSRTEPQGKAWDRQLLPY